MSVFPSKIFLIGFQGSGKSTIGKLLANLLKYRFVDTDTEIVKKAKQSVPQLFAQKGEPYFRRLESNVIDTVCNQKGNRVVALGGGSFLSAVNRRRVAQAGVSVYLRCSQQELFARTLGDTNRPLLKSEKTSKRQAQLHFKKLLQARIPGYKTADITFTTSKLTPKTASNELLKAMKARYGQN